MIDLENEMVENLIKQTKNQIEDQILDCFECHINPQFNGEPKEGIYYISIFYECQEKDFGMATNVEISEEDYKRYQEYQKEEVK